MATPTLEQLKALPEAYLMEQNPTSSQMYRTSIVFIIVDTLVFSAFMYATYRNPKRSRIEQCFLMPLAYLSAIGMCLTGILTFRFGTGRHIAYYLLNDPETIVKLLQLQAGIEIFYMTSVTLPKIVILLLYQRIFMDRYARAAVWSLVAILVMFFFTGLILAFVHCRPYAFKWDKTIDGTCGDIMAAYRAVSFPNIVTDFFIMIIPIPLICKLHIGIWRKIGILITFLIGSLGFITSILRCLTFYRLNLFEDPIFLGGETTKWSVIETSAYFICACLPRLRQPLAAVFEKSGISTFMSSKFNAIWGSKPPSQRPTLPDSKLLKGISKIQAAQLSNDTVGFAQLDDLQLESQASHSGRLSFINSSRE